MSSDSLVKCIRCKRNFIRGEEYDNHVCVPHLNGSKDISAVQWWEDKTEYGEPMLFVIGADGYNYRITQVKRRTSYEELDLTQQPSNEEEHQPLSDTQNGHHDKETV